ncbi:superoxide dismutase [Rubeoparvulum massiliense]|uniref:superoxide dismutase n=1 Tax=Rubeoparvulum massiliense TaxID=1631346 RepID=UPI00065E62FD|nr:superoxide dismutase [Rubeoparvulum massiliense]
MTTMKQSQILAIFREWQYQVNQVLNQIEQIPDSRSFAHDIKQLRDDLAQIGSDFSSAPSISLINKGNQEVGSFFSTTYHGQQIETVKGYWQQLILYFQEWEDYLYKLRNGEQRAASIRKIPSERQIISWSYAKEQTTPLGKHQLPELPYSYGALAPFLEEQLLRQHHQFHGKLVAALNQGEKELQAILEDSERSLIPATISTIAHFGSEHFLHSLFWEMLTQRGRGVPVGEFADQLDDDWGGFAEFQHVFTTTAQSLKGDGWAILGWAPRIHRLIIYTAKKDGYSMQDTIPLLALDLWKHAYYSQYGEDKHRYIEAWWNFVDWHGVNERFKMARIVKWSTG